MPRRFGSVLMMGVGLGLALGWIMSLWIKLPPLSGSNSTHLGPSLGQVQSLSSLVTARVDVTDVQETSLEGYTGGIKAALLIKGDFLLGTDLSKAHFQEVNQLTKT